MPQRNRQKWFGHPRRRWQRWHRRVRRGTSRTGMGRGTRVGDSSSGDGPLRPTWEWRDDGPEISPVLGISPFGSTSQSRETQWEGERGTGRERGWYDTSWISIHRSKGTHDPIERTEHPQCRGIDTCTSPMEPRPTTSIHENKREEMR